LAAHHIKALRQWTANSSQDISLDSDLRELCEDAVKWLRSTATKHSWNNTQVRDLYSAKVSEENQSALIMSFC